MKLWQQKVKQIDKKNLVYLQFKVQEPYTPRNQIVTL